MAFHMTGICQVYARYMTYGIYLVYTCHMTMFFIYQEYTRYIPDIHLRSSYVGYIPGIYHHYKLSRVSRCDVVAY